MKTSAETARALGQLADCMAKELGPAGASDLGAPNGGAEDTASDLLDLVQQRLSEEVRRRCQQKPHGSASAQADGEVEEETQLHADSASAAPTRGGDDQTVGLQAAGLSSDRYRSSDHPAVGDAEASGLPASTRPGIDGETRVTGGDHLQGHSRPVQLPPGYDYLSTLGKGGMGIVYQVRDRKLDRVVAMKMVLAGDFASTEELERFRLEARAAAKLSHANIISVYEVGEFDGTPYFTTEYVEGQELSELFADSVMDDVAASALLEKVARAVHYSHQKGIVHRDLKPQNILITRAGEPKVADFGLAKMLDDDQQRTGTEQILGTPKFMAPEQARSSRDIGPAADVYAMGAILYCVLTGRPPFVGPTPFDTVQQVVSVEPVAPSRLQPGLDGDLETICLNCLRKEPERRYASAGHLADDLQRYREGKPILARPVSRRERLWKWCKRNPRVAWLMGLAASLLVSLMVGGYVFAAVFNAQKKTETVLRHEAQLNAELAVKAQGVAESHQKLAEDQAEVALDANRVILYQTQEFFKRHPELAKLRKGLLQELMKQIDRAYADNYKYNVREVFRASAMRQLAEVQLTFGDEEDALQNLRKAEGIAKQLAVEGEWPNPEVSLANLDLLIGDAHRELEQFEEARRRYLSCIENRKKYFANNPQFEQILVDQAMAEAYGRLGDLLLKYGRISEAELYVTKGVAARKAWVEAFPGERGQTERMQNLAGAYAQLSRLCEKTGKMRAMIEMGIQSLKILDDVAKSVDDFPTKFNPALVRRTLARQSLIAGFDDDAGVLLNEALGMLQLLEKDNSDHKRIPGEIAEVYYLLGVYQVRKDQPAADSFRRAAEIMRQRIKKAPDDVHAKGMLLKILARSGKVAEAQQLADEMAQKTDSMFHCGYAACGYGLLATHLDQDPKRQEALRNQATEMTRKLIRLGYESFKELRSESLDFLPLQSYAPYNQMLDEEEARIASAEQAKQEPAQ